MLNYAMKNDMLDINIIRAKIHMSRMEEYLANHPYAIWQGKNGSWYTYLPDEDKGRVLIRKKDKEKIKQSIVDYYIGANTKKTLVNVMIEWLNFKLQYNEIRKQTYDEYISNINSFFKGSDIADVEISKIKEYELEVFIKDAIKNLSLTHKSYTKLKTLIKGTFKYARKRELTDININDFFELLDVPSKTFRKIVKTDDESVFTDDEVRMIIDLLHKRRYNVTNLAIELGFYTGMRAGEIVALQKEDINFEESYINVCKTEVTYRDQDGKLIHDIQKATKSDASNRKVIMNSKAREVLEIAISLNPDAEFIFTRESGCRVLACYLSGRLSYTCSRLGILPRSMHKARKTYCTKMINSGVNEAFIINQMGHSNINISKNYYYFNNTKLDEGRFIIENVIQY